MNYYQFKERIETLLGEVAAAADAVTEGLAFDALHITENNRSDWEDLETKLMRSISWIKEMQRHDYEDFTEREMEPDEGPRQYERV